MESLTQVAFMKQLHRKGEEAGRQAIEQVIRDNAPQAREMGDLTPSLDAAVHQIAVGVIFGALREMDLTPQEKLEIAASVGKAVREYARRSGGIVFGRAENN